MCNFADNSGPEAGLFGTLAKQASLERQRGGPWMREWARALALVLIE